MQHSTKTILWTLPLLLLLFVGCPSNRNKIENHVNESEQLRFAFISCTVNADFYDPVKKGMNDAAAMLGVKSDFLGTEGVNLEAQAQMVIQAVEAGYHGIALNIIDPGAFDTVIREAMNQGVPVVGFNVDDHSTSNARLSSVNQQLYFAGEHLARHLLPHVPNEAHVLMTMHDKGVSALEDRLHGMQTILKEHRSVRSSVLISGNKSKEGAEKIADFLENNQDVRIVLGTGQADTEAAGMAIETHFPQKGYWSAGFDLSSKTLQLIKDGHIRCTVDQQPYIQGFYPVVQLAQYLRYGLMPSDYDAGAAIIDSTNVNQVSHLTELGYR